MPAIGPTRFTRAQEIALATRFPAFATQTQADAIRRETATLTRSSAYRSKSPHMYATLYYWGLIANAAYHPDAFARHTQMFDVLKITPIRDKNEVSYSVLRDLRSRSIVIAIRGTYELSKDVATDLKASTVATSKLVKDIPNNWYHHGSMGEAALRIVRDNRDLIRNLLVTYPDWPLVVVGHSLGAGTAALTTIILRHIFHEQQARICGFGFATPAVLSEQACRAMCSFFITIVYRYDPVPRLSLVNAMGTSAGIQLADQLYVPGKILFIGEYAGSLTPAFILPPTHPVLTTIPLIEVADHFMTSYLAAITINFCNFAHITDPATYS